jgi:hypothetical protein
MDISAGNHISLTDEKERPKSILERGERESINRRGNPNPCDPPLAKMGVSLSGRFAGAFTVSGRGTPGGFRMRAEQPANPAGRSRCPRSLPVPAASPGGIGARSLSGFEYDGFILEEKP